MAAGESGRAMMKKLSDADYYAARLRAELEAVASATDEQVRAAHQVLADHYRQRLAARQDLTMTETPRASIAPSASETRRRA
jgi:hypothetical protein